MPFPPKKDGLKKEVSEKKGKGKLPFFLQKDVRGGEKGKVDKEEKDAEKGAATRRLKGEAVKPKGKKGKCPECGKDMKDCTCKEGKKEESGNDKYNKAKADLMAKVKGDGDKKKDKGGY